jgi:hypothetical protein
LAAAESTSPDRARSTSRCTSANGAGRSLTEAAGATSHRPRHDTSTTSTSESFSVAVAQLGDVRLAVAQEARQVVADVHRDLGRRLGAEVWVERDQSLDLVERPTGIARQLLEVLARQPPVSRLDEVERRDQRWTGELARSGLDARHAAGAELDRMVGQLGHDDADESRRNCSTCTAQNLNSGILP